MWNTEQKHIIKKAGVLYKKLFELRWAIAGILLVFLVANRYHGESLAAYDRMIQPGMGNEYVEPIFGEERAIRSDEFLVETPNKLASVADGEFGKYNEIARGTKTLNAINGVYIGYATLGRSPFQYAYKIMGAEYAYSFCWYAPIILCFMAALEFFFILSRRNPLLAVTGACLEVASPFYLWWGFPGFLLGAQGAIVCAYYFIYAKSGIKKILFGAGVAVSFANYVLTLYPAWIVPMGYVILCLLIWLFHENWPAIKKFRKRDWGIVAAMAVFAGTLVCSYLWTNQEYIQAIMQTRYPGERISTGGLSIQKLFLYSQSYLYAYREIGNASEASVILNFFPVPTIAAGWHWVKSEKKDWLTGGLLAVMLFFFIYVTTGIPTILAKITFLGMSAGIRVVDIMGIIQVYFLIILLADAGQKKLFSLTLGGAVSLLTVGASLLCSKIYDPNYLSWKWMLVSGILIFTVGMILLTDLRYRFQKYLCYGLIFISVAGSIYIRPISKGFDAVTSKPVSQKIQQIRKEEPDSKWIAYGRTMYLPGFTLANGVPTINSTNTYPNLELWTKLDPAGIYEDIYNRYAHVSVEFTEEDTSFELLYTDSILLKLSYKDFRKTGVKYIVSLEELASDQEETELEEIYNEYGTYIYQVRD